MSKSLFVPLISKNLATPDHIIRFPSKLLSSLPSSSLLATNNTLSSNFKKSSQKYVQTINHPQKPIQSNNKNISEIELFMKSLKSMNRENQNFNEKDRMDLLYQFVTILSSSSSWSLPFSAFPSLSPLTIVADPTTDINKLLLISKDQGTASENTTYDAVNVTLDEVSRCVWLLGNLITMNVLNKAHKQQNYLFNAMIYYIDIIHSQTLDNNNTSSQQQQSQLYRVQLIRLMSGLEKLGFQWAIVPSGLQTSYLNLLLLDEDKYSNSFTSTSSNNGNGSEDNDDDNIREVSSVLWTLGRMGFNINNDCSSIAAIGSSKSKKSISRKKALVAAALASSSGDDNENMKQQILDRVYSVFNSTALSSTPSSSSLTGQSVSMILKGISKIGFTWSDIMNYKPTSSSVPISSLSQSILSSIVGSSSHKTSTIISESNKQASAVSSSSSLSLWKSSELIDVLQAFGFMKAEWSNLPRYFQQEVETKLLSYLTITTKNAITTTNNNQRSVFGTVASVIDKSSILSVSTLSSLIRSLGLLRYSFHSSSYDGSSNSDDQQRDQQSSSSLQQLAESLATSIIQAAPKMNYFDLECVLEGLVHIQFPSTVLHQQVQQAIYHRLESLLLLASSPLSSPLLLSPSSLGSPNVYFLENVWSLLVQLTLHDNSNNGNGKDAMSSDNNISTNNNVNNQVLLRSLFNITIQKLHVFENYQLPALFNSMAIMGFTNATANVINYDDSNNNNNNNNNAQQQQQQSTSSSLIISTTQRHRMIAITSRILLALPVAEAIGMLYSLYTMQFNYIDDFLPSQSSMEPNDVDNIDSNSNNSKNNKLSNSNNDANIKPIIEPLKVSEPLHFTLQKFVFRYNGDFREQDISLLYFILGKLGMNWSRDLLNCIDSSSNVSNMQSADAINDTPIVINTNKRSNSSNNNKNSSKSIATTSVTFSTTADTNATTTNTATPATFSYAEMFMKKSFNRYYKTLKYAPLDRLAMSVTGLGGTEVMWHSDEVFLKWANENMTSTFENQLIKTLQTSLLLMKTYENDRNNGIIFTGKESNTNQQQQSIFNYNSPSLQISSNGINVLNILESVFLLIYGMMKVKMEYKSLSLPAQKIFKEFLQYMILRSSSSSASSSTITDIESNNSNRTTNQNTTTTAAAAAIMWTFLNNIYLSMLLNDATPTKWQILYHQDGSSQCDNIRQQLENSIVRELVQIKFDNDVMNKDKIKKSFDLNKKFMML